jgi:putative adhesin
MSPHSKGEIDMSTTRKITIAVAACFGVAALAAGVAFGAKSVFGSKHTTHTRFAAPIHRIVVDGGAGDVKLTAGGRLDVSVKQTSSWLFSKPKLRQYVSGGVLHLESHCRHGFLCDTEYEVRAPAGVAIEVDLKAADVQVHGAPGDVSVDTNAGDVDVEITRAPRRIDVESNAGDIDVTVPRGTYAVTTSTDAGDESVRGIVRYDRAAHAIRATTNAGDVTVSGR